MPWRSFTYPMTPDSETAWAELETRALRLLEHAKEVEPRAPVRRYGSLLRFWHYPAHGPQTAWTILRPGRKTPGAGWPKVREVTWDRVPDQQRLFDPDVLQAGDLDSTPTLRLREADLPEREIQALVAAAADLAVPLVMFSHKVGLEGEYFGLETYEVSPSVRLQWWGAGPIEWRHFTDWCGQVRCLLVEHLDKTG
jgi:hypothetical protein